MLRGAFRDTRGSAAAEMALLTPLFVLLLLGSLELGRYFYHEHKLVQAVRDAARWAGRQPFAAFPACGSTVNSSDNLYTRSMQIARTGQPNGGLDRLPLWGHASTQFTMTTVCSTSGGGTAYKGIYNGSADGARLIRIDASLPYNAMFRLPGLGGAGLRLNARQEAAVMGI